MKFFQKITALFFGAAAFLIIPGLAFATGDGEGHHFSDVSDTHENYQAINYLQVEEVVQGYGDGTYKPEQEINRAEFLKIVVESEGYEISDASDCYLDVKEEWFSPYVCTATDLGIVSGYSDGTFKPAQTINFAEASKIISEAFLLQVANSPQENWYQNYVVALELLNAIPTSIDAFSKPVTRGEMAEMVWRIRTENREQASYSYEQIKDLDSNQVRSITLRNDGDGKVSWTTDGVSSKGFKVVWSKNTEPTYPTEVGDQYLYFSSSTASSATLNAFDGFGTYYVRVCEYTGGSCDVYSNEITVFLDESDDDNDDDDLSDDSSDDAVSSIALSAGDNGEVTWTIDGNCELGFKVVWSKDSEPTYPLGATDHYLYYSDPSTSSATVTAEDGAGTYYVRVCEYLGGECGVYSNEITVTLDSDEFESSVSEITLTHLGDGEMSWSWTGDAQFGFKLVWSQSSGATFPGRSSGDRSNYFPDDSETTGSISAFNGADTYWVRVCEYNGNGGCGTYSNEVEVYLED
ncbi:S-layer homology domain-containing protein [Patescibacteria group bacterium]|nr:S-layer homology domain-containing protein [Patescibacteria group bacterium]